MTTEANAVLSSVLLLMGALSQLSVSMNDLVNSPEAKRLAEAEKARDEAVTALVIADQQAGPRPWTLQNQYPVTVAEAVLVSKESILQYAKGGKRARTVATMIGWVLVTAGALFAVVATSGQFLAACCRG